MNRTNLRTNKNNSKMETQVKKGKRIDNNQVKVIPP